MGTFVTYNSKLKSRSQELRKNSTLSEVLLWQQLKGKQLFGYQFYRQKPIADYIVDFYCPVLKLVIEVDGFSHDFKIDYDQRREQKLTMIGLRMLHFQDSEIKKDMNAVIQRIIDYIETLTTSP